MFRKIAAAIAFSPRCEAIMKEAQRMSALFDAEFVLIHIGKYNEKDEKMLYQLMESAQFDRNKVRVIWEKGDPSHKILSICKKEQVDLLIAGALEKENLFTYYIGSIARKILRKARCSVLVITKPSISPKPFKKIVIDGSGLPTIENTIRTGCQFGALENSESLTIIRELSLYGLNLTAEEYTETEYQKRKQELFEEERKKVEKMIGQEAQRDLPIDIKITTGKSGFELSKFAKATQADLLVVEAPKRKLNIFDRVITHDLEYILANLPSNLLLYTPTSKK